MEKLEKTNQPNFELLIKTADELDNLQKQENDGRGVSCVKEVVSYLRMGKLQEARAVCFTDHDKIINYPALKEFIVTNLFEEGEEHPWSTLERLQHRD